MLDAVAAVREFFRFLNDNNGAALVLLTAFLAWSGWKEHRASFQLRHASRISHYKGEDYPAKGIWFLVANTGGLDSRIDMGRSFVLLERREFRDRPSWLARQLKGYWKERLENRRKRVGRVSVWTAMIWRSRWQIQGVSIYAGEHWYEMEKQNQKLGLEEQSDIPREVKDLTVPCSSMRTCVAEYSTQDEGRIRTRRAILVVYPVIGSPSRIRFIVRG